MAVAHRSSCDIAPYDIAIIGGGLVGSLLALGMRKHRPDLSFTLIESDAQFGGRLLEACLADEIPDILKDIVEPSTVKAWPGCFVNFPGRSQRFADSVILVDPRQLHLDIVDHALAPHCHAGSAVRAICGNRIVHARGEVEARMIIDASDTRVQTHLEVERMTRYRDFNLVHDLALPILADMSETAGSWSFLQLFPIDGARMVVEHFRHRSVDDDAASAASEQRAGTVISLGGATAKDLCSPDRGLTAAHFPSLLQIAAEMAAGFVTLDLDDTKVRRFFAERMASGRERTRRMFELVRLSREADGRSVS